MNRLLVGTADKTNLLLQFLQNEFPDGLTIIDPTGALAEAAANRLPVSLTQRALYFDPADLRNPIGLNVLENIPPDHRHQVTEQLCQYFEAMWPNGWGAQSNFILANCLRLLLEIPGSTLLGVLKLLSNNFAAEQHLVRCTDPVLLANWRIINGWDKKQHQAAVAPLQNKIGTLLLSPMIRNIVGQSRSTVTHRVPILIANLDRARLGDLTARLLGGLLIARSTGPVYIHSFGFFASGSDGLASLFPQDRFTITINFLDELSPRLRQEVLGIEQKYVFKANRRDAEELAFYVRLLNPRVLVELDHEEVRTQTGLLYPKAPPNLHRLRALKRRTHACHTRTRETVERAIVNYFSQPAFVAR
jgi:hypothetical protein